MHEFVDFFQQGETAQRDWIINMGMDALKKFINDGDVEILQTFLLEAEQKMYPEELKINQQKWD